MNADLLSRVFTALGIPEKTPEILKFVARVPGELKQKLLLFISDLLLNHKMS